MAREAGIQGTGGMDCIQINKLANGILRITGDGSFADRAYRSYQIGQFHDTDEIWMGPSGARFKQMDSKNYENPELMRLRLAEKKTLSPSVLEATRAS